jgi:hypothetical protein
MGHADLTAHTLELVEAELAARLANCAPHAVALVRAGAGLPLVFGRTVHRAARWCCSCPPTAE